MKGILKLLIPLIVIAGGVYFGKNFYTRSQIGGRATAEHQKQASEIETCKKRLASFYEGWKQYKADHKGSEPATIESMIPKYIKNTSDLVCPTYERWIKTKWPVFRAEFEVDRRKIQVTYGFVFTSPATAMQRRRLKDRAPLIVCPTHREAVFHAAYEGIVDPDKFNRLKWGEPVAEAEAVKQLVVRMDGSVTDFDPEEAINASAKPQ